MSDEHAIRIAGLGKMYKIFSSRLDNFLDALGLYRFLPVKRPRHREFWALRGIDLEVGRGERVGIVGQNGAGKTTLLKLITGNVAPTEGQIDVRGEVHALMNTGAGFHPEFSGRENIEASLVYQGLSRDEIRDAIEEIAEFTELSEFLDRPFKTYSAGMQARLTFATATTIKPDILIIDEILGAGDGYFVAKSTERVAKLVESEGTTVLIVSHALDMTVRFCERAIWIDRGKVVESGDALEVVKSYEHFLRARNERRLKAKNRAAAARDGDAVRLGFYTASVAVRLTSTNSSVVDVAEITLREGDDVYESVSVGDAQDSDTNRQASVLVDESSGWGPPQTNRKAESWRGLVSTAPAAAQFFLYSFDPGRTYRVEVRHRAPTATEFDLVVTAGDTEHTQRVKSAAEWTTDAISFDAPAEKESSSSPKSAPGEAPEDSRSIRRWPGDDAIAIGRVELLDARREARTSFRAGHPLTLTLGAVASTAGRFPVIPTAAIYRLDGVPVTRLRGTGFDAEFEAGETRTLQLDLGSLNLGDGNYVISVGLFRRFDPARPEEARPYEILDRSFEFEVWGNRPNMDSIFQHPGEWSLLPR